MFSQRELVQLRIATDMKIASLKRGMNTAREPAFRQLYESELSDYSALQLKLLKEVSGNEQVPQVNVAGKK